jgi:adenylosuccinate lyase
MKFYEEGADFKTALLADEELVGHLGAKTIEGLFDLDHHLAHVDEIFARTFGEA